MTPLLIALLTGCKVTDPGEAPARRLMTPQFLYRLEDTVQGDSPEKLDEFELASRLSYFLWDSMPDAELFASAANGQLSNENQVKAQTERMLESSQAREAVVHFHSQWLDLEEVYTSNADMDTYQPQYLPEVWDLIDPDEELFVEELEEVWSSYLIGARAGMVLEAELFIERTIFDGGGTLFWLMTDNHGYVTSIESEEDTEALGTDRIYGVTDADLLPGEVIEVSLDNGNIDYDLRLTPVAFPADQRAGILTLGAVLTGHAHPVHPAPILRDHRSALRRRRGLRPGGLPGCGEHQPGAHRSDHLTCRVHRLPQLDQPAGLRV